MAVDKHPLKTARRARKAANFAANSKRKQTRFEDRQQAKKDKRTHKQAMSTIRVNDARGLKFAAGVGGVTKFVGGKLADNAPAMIAAASKVP